MWSVTIVCANCRIASFFDLSSASSAFLMSMVFAATTIAAMLASVSAGALDVADVLPGVGPPASERICMDEAGAHAASTAAPTSRAVRRECIMVELLGS